MQGIFYTEGKEPKSRSIQEESGERKWVQKKNQLKLTAGKFGGKICMFCNLATLLC